MRYKELVLKKLEQLDHLVNGLNSQLSRPVTREQLSLHVEAIKSKIEDVAGTVSLENEG